MLQWQCVGIWAAKADQSPRATDPMWEIAFHIELEGLAVHWKGIITVCKAYLQHCRRSALLITDLPLLHWRTSMCVQQSKVKCLELSSLPRAMWKGREPRESTSLSKYCQTDPPINPIRSSRPAQKWRLIKLIRGSGDEEGCKANSRVKSKSRQVWFTKRKHRWDQIRLADGAEFVSWARLLWPDIS